MILIAHLHLPSLELSYISTLTTGWASLMGHCKELDTVERRDSDIVVSTRPTKEHPVIVK